MKKKQIAYMTLGGILAYWINSKDILRLFIIIVLFGIVPGYLIRRDIIKMLEKIIRSKSFKLLVYVFGAILEIVGFGLIFNYTKVMDFIHMYPSLYAISLIIGGYLMAVSVRRR